MSMLVLTEASMLSFNDVNLLYTYHCHHHKHLIYYGPSKIVRSHKKPRITNWQLHPGWQSVHRAVKANQW